MHQEDHGAKVNGELRHDGEDCVHVEDVRQRALLRQARQGFRSKQKKDTVSIKQLNKNQIKKLRIV